MSNGWLLSADLLPMRPSSCNPAPLHGHERSFTPCQWVDSRQGAYPIHLAPQAGSWLRKAVEKACPSARRVAVLTDTHVARHHAPSLMKALQGLDKTLSLHTWPAGESEKNLETVAKLYHDLAEEGLQRCDALIALGGGVVGDITGFVASTYVRGLAYLYVPTTTLAAVDASIGGKTAVNTSYGKNLVGTFYPPRAVLVCLSYLKTQTPRIHAAGWVEALKIAATLDEALFDDILAHIPALQAFQSQPTLALLHRSMALKASVVAQDECDSRLRSVLNYGHTFGHAIEAGEHYQLLHGEAVGMGLLGESAWAHAAGLACKSVYTSLKSGLQALGMPTQWQHAKVSLEALHMDKKYGGDTVCLPVVSRIGHHTLQEIPMVSLVTYLTLQQTALQQTALQQTALPPSGLKKPYT